MSVAALEFRPWDAQLAEHLVLIGSRLKQGRFALGGADWRFSLAMGYGRMALPARPWVISMEWGGGRLHLLSGRASLSLLYAHQFPNAAVDVLPEDLALAAFRLAWRELASRLEELGGRRVRLVHAAAADERVLEGAAYRFRFSLDSEVASDGIQGVLAADGPGLALLALLARRLPAEPAVRNPDLPIPLRLEAGEARLKLETVRTLSLHDVVFPDTVIDAEQPTLWLRADSRHTARAHLDGQSLVIDSILEKNSPMPNSPASPPVDDGQALARLDDVEVRLAFDLGEKMTRLGDLAVMQPGQVIPLDVPLERTVNVRVNGRLIGRGELVRVADRVGVRILEISNPATEAGKQ
jgi:type III secretion protein Q